MQAEPNLQGETLRFIFAGGVYTDRQRRCPMKRLIIWILAFAAGLIMLLFRMNISRYMADLTTLMIAGTVLSILGGAGILLELYFTNHKNGK